MNNLKRILSLALASVMLVGMMVVGASATDYPDDEKIVYKTAVENLAALGIMNGDERGFRPEDGLTRAEAAKMLATIQNRGILVTYGTKDIPTFKDIKGHWAEANIEYAAAFGIVNGHDGSFNPQGELKIVELVRMCLNMMGITEGVTGSDWELKTTVAATNAGLFEGLEGTPLPSAKVTRDQAAQILWNALEADMAGSETYTYTAKEEVTTGLATKWQINLVPGATEPTLVSGKESKDWTALDGKSFQTQTQAEAEIDKVSTAATKSTHYTLDSVLVPVTELRDVTKTAVETLGHKFLSLQKNAGTSRITKIEDDGKGTYTVTLSNGEKYTKVATDYSKLMGQNVQVLYKSTSSVYGITPVGSVVFEGDWGTYAYMVSTMDPTSTTTAAIQAAPIVTFNANASKGTIGAPTGMNDEDNIKVIRNGSAYVAVTVPTYVRQINAVGANSVTLNANLGSGSAVLSTKAKAEEVIVYDGIAKGDYVLAVPAANTVSGLVELTKATTVTGTVAGTRTNEVLVDGTWYGKADVTLTLDTITLGKEITLVVLPGDYYAVAKAPAAAASTDLLLVTKLSQNSTGGLGAYQEAQVYFVKDGTSAIVRINNDKYEDGTTTALAVGKFYTYKVDGNEYKLNAPVAANLGYDGTLGTAGYVNTTATVGGKLIADDAVVIVAYDKANNNTTTNSVTGVDQCRKVEFITGKELKAWGASWGAAATQGFYKSENGLDYAKVVFLAADASSLPNATGTQFWGYVVSNPYTIIEGTKTYKTYSLWNGAETVTVKDLSTSAAGLGDVIQYQDLGNGYVSFVQKMAAGDAKAITGYNAGDQLIALDGATPIKLSKNVVMLWIDSVKKEGAPTGEITLATENETVPGVFMQNAFVKVNGSSEVEVLVIDVNGKVSGAANVINTPAADATLNGAVGSTEVKAKNDGVYDFKNATSLGTGISSNANASDLVAFLFTARNSGTTTAGTQAYTLTVTDNTGAVVYKETSGALTDGTTTSGTATDVKYFFYVDRTGAHLIAGSATPSKPATPPAGWALFDTAANGAAYTYTIEGADGAIYGHGSFSL